MGRRIAWTVAGVVFGALGFAVMLAAFVTDGRAW